MGWTVPMALLEHLNYPVLFSLHCVVARAVYLQRSSWSDQHKSMKGPRGHRLRSDWTALGYTVHNSTCFCKQAASNAPWPESRRTNFRIKSLVFSFVVTSKWWNFTPRSHAKEKIQLKIIQIQKYEVKLCVLLFGLFPEDVVEICEVLCQVELGAELQWY